MTCIGLTSRRFFLSAFVIFTLGLPAAFGQSRQITDYTYDDAGNLVSTDSIVSDGPPAVVSLSPAVLRVGPTVVFMAIGSNLKLAEVSASDTKVSVGNVQSTGTSITFELLAESGALSGPMTLTFSTRQGSDTAEIEVQPSLPEIRVSPSPPAVAVGATLTLGVRLTNADVFNHELTLSTGDTGVATVSPSTVSVLSGNTESASTVTLGGVTLGQTTLTISTPFLDDVLLPVFVTETFALPVGDNAFFSPPLGVVLGTDPGTPSVAFGPFTNALQVLKVPSAPGPVSTDLDFVSPVLGVMLGAGLFDVSPDGFAAGGGPTAVAVTGFGLDTVTDVDIVPPDDVVLSGFTAAPGGASATFTIDAAPAAALGARRLIFSSTNGALQPARAAADRILIGAAGPVIESVDPILLTRLTLAETLTIRGRDLSPLTGVDITPPDGLTLGSPAANADGTIVTLGIAVSEDAPLGERVVTVMTPLGISSPTDTEANTIIISNGPTVTFSPITAPFVGVVLEADTTVPPDTISPVVAPNVGVALGALGWSVLPNAVALDTSVELIIQGFGLEDVSSIEFVPADGITLDGPPVVLPDGTEVRVLITVGTSAPLSTRRVSVSALSGAVPFSPADGDRIRIVAGAPSIDSVVPSIAAQGSSFTLTITGSNFDGAVSVFAEPSDGISFAATPTSSPDGTELNVQVSIDVDAPPGPRTIRVDGPVGVSSSNGTAANTLTVVTP